MAEVRFRRINGRVVPIRTSNAVAAAQTGIGVYKGIKTAKTITAGAIVGSTKKTNIKPDRLLQAVGFGTAVADGVLSGATFFTSGVKGFFLGQGVGIGLSLGSSAANVASFAGSRGKLKNKAKAAARQEAINTIAGNAAFAGTLFAIPKSRRIIFEKTTKALKFVASKAKFIK